MKEKLTIHPNSKSQRLKFIYYYSHTLYDEIYRIFPLHMLNKQPSGFKVARKNSRKLSEVHALGPTRLDEIQLLL